MRISGFHKALAVPAAVGMAALAATVPSGVSSAAAIPNIQHVVVIYQENVSFDHYFATYPKAANPSGEPAFSASPGTPDVNGLSGALLTHNPNGANPTRLDRSQALTCDQGHAYTPEQLAADHGAMDKFVSTVGKGTGNAANGSPCHATDVMNYYDGNTVTAMWNYAQHFAMSDNSRSSTYGPSTPGALNLIAGQTHGVTSPSVASDVENGTVIGDPQPLGDACDTREAVQLSGQNVGDLLNAKGVTWGWFQGGFRATDSTGALNCKASHPIGQAIGGTGSSGPNPWGNTSDYIPHHEPFQYFPQTANPQHLAPTGPIGTTDQANHQYDLNDFFAAVRSNNFPAVSFLKASAYQDGHAFYSDPLDEQMFLASTINFLEAQPAWAHTAVIVAYDDSDGWYDHQFKAPTSPSHAPADALNGAHKCGNQTPAPTAYQDRCGPGFRQPLLVISPYAKANSVDHRPSTAASILRFIEDNWKLGRIGNQSFDATSGRIDGMLRGDGSTPPLVLDPQTGEPVSG